MKLDDKLRAFEREHHVNLDDVIARARRIYNYGPGISVERDADRLGPVRHVDNQMPNANGVWINVAVFVPDPMVPK